MARMRGSVNHTVSVGKPEIKRPLERPEQRWEDKIKTNLEKTGWDVVNWTDLVQLRQYAAGSGEESSSINCREFHDQLRTH